MLFCLKLQHYKAPFFKTKLVKNILLNYKQVTPFSVLKTSRLSVGLSWSTKAETPCDLGASHGLRRAVCTLGYTREGCRAPKGKASQRPPHPRMPQLWPHQCPSDEVGVSPLGPSQLPLATCISASSMPAGSREGAGRDPVCELRASQLQEGRDRCLFLHPRIG